MEDKNYKELIDDYLNILMKLSLEKPLTDEEQRLASEVINCRICELNLRWYEENHSKNKEEGIENVY